MWQSSIYVMGVMVLGFCFLTAVRLGVFHAFYICPTRSGKLGLNITLKQPPDIKVLGSIEEHFILMAI